MDAYLDFKDRIRIVNTYLSNVATEYSIIVHVRRSEMTQTYIILYIYTYTVYAVQKWAPTCIYTKTMLDMHYA